MLAWLLCSVSACWSASDGASGPPHWVAGRLIIDEAQPGLVSQALRSQITLRVAGQPGVTLSPTRSADTPQDAVQIHIRVSPEHVRLSVRPLQGQGATFDVMTPMASAAFGVAFGGPLDALDAGFETLRAMHALDAVGEEALRGALSPDRVDADAVLRLRQAALKGFALRRIAERRDLGALDALCEALTQANGVDATPIDQELALRAVGTLVALGDRRAVEPLIALAQHKDPAFVLQVAFAVGALGGRAATAYLVTLGSGHLDAEVRQGAAAALGELLGRKRRVLG